MFRRLAMLCGAAAFLIAGAARSPARADGARDAVGFGGNAITEPRTIIPEHASVLARPDDVCLNRQFTQGSQSLKPMQPCHEHVAALVTAHLDRSLQAILDDTFRDGLDLSCVQRRTKSRRHIDFVKFHFNGFQHDNGLIGTSIDRGDGS